MLLLALWYISATKTIRKLNIDPVVRLGDCIMQFLSLLYFLKGELYEYGNDIQTVRDI